MPFDPLALLLEMESEITDNMTALLSRGAVESANWQAEKLIEVGALRNANIKTVEKYLADIRAKLYTYYEAAGTDKIMESQIPGLSDVLPDGVSATLANTWAVWEYKTMNQLRNLGMTLIDGAESTYIQIIYKSAAKMLIGSNTLRTAIAETAAEWLKNGIPALIDKAGREWSVEGYASLVLRSNETQMVWASQEAAFDAYDVDLVEITSHLGARPNCAPYQGRVYSRSGRSTKYPPLSSTSIGQPDGIKGCNCGHDIFPYNPSVGKTFKPYPKKLNDAAYKASQEQRYYERRIRAAKTQYSIAQISKNPKIVQKYKDKVTAVQAKMRDFIKESDRTRRYDREKVY